MKRILTLLALAIIGLNRIGATPQICNGLIVNGEHWAMFCWPIDKALHNAIRNYAEIYGGPSLTCCWDGYTSTWAIRDGMLVLDSIDVLTDNENGDLSIGFRPLGQDTIDAAFRSIGRTTRAATWYSGTFNAIQGEMFSYEEGSGGYRHGKREMVVKVENGKVISAKIYNNRIVANGFSFSDKYGDSQLDCLKELTSRFTFSPDEFPELKGKRIAIQILNGDSSGNITDISIIKKKSITLSLEREKELTARLLTEINKSAPWTTYSINNEFVPQDRHWTFPYRFPE